MSTIDLNALLPTGTIFDQTRQDILRGLTSDAIQGFSAGTDANGSSDGGANPASALPQQPTKDVTEQIAELNRQVTSLGSTQQTQIGATQDNTQAVAQNTASQSGGGSSISGTIGSFASSLFSGLTLSPLISGLIGLFGGDSSSSSTVTSTPFQLPAAVQDQAGITGGGNGSITSVDYGQNGLARPQAASSQAQVSIQVNAMDSKSFLDHSDEIASAVRQAILNSNSINDVIADL